MEQKDRPNFITNIIDEDIQNNVYTDNRVHTRFPPEPNGYLHIGHAKSSLLNYRLAQKYDGLFNLRFDDTNPIKEEVEFVEAIQRDLHWLGVEWGDRLFFASSYFSEMVAYAEELIQKGLAYVDELSGEEMRAYRGTLTKPGKNSPYRDRAPEESLKLFKEMVAGKHPEESMVLRAKIDMASPNMNMRDPVIYRILHVEHPNTHEEWFVYPMYDFAHPLEDALEGITHSICTLEFEDHRPFYDWVLDNLDDYQQERPQQIEFAKLNLTQTIMGKRYLKQLVDSGIADGWDDPRLPTISGLRRRGYTPESIQNFCEEIGVAKANSTVDLGMLEHFIRDDLKLKAPRYNAVLNPLKVTITNYPEDQEVEWLDVQTNQEVPEMGTHRVPFTKELYIEKEDFMEVPVKKYFRLFPGNEVRLRGAYFVTCNEVVKNEEGEVIELKCTYDPETKSGSGFTGRKVKGTIHWVSAENNVPIEVHLLNPLLEKDTEFDSENFLEKINPDSRIIVQGYGEPEIKKMQAFEKAQFIRNGYFSVDPKYSKEDQLVFNRVVELKSSWRPTKK